MTSQSLKNDGALRSLMLSAVTLVSPLAAATAPTGFVRAEEQAQDEFGAQHFGNTRDWLQTEPELESWNAEMTGRKVSEYLETISVDATVRESALEALTRNEEGAGGRDLEKLARVIATTDSRVEALCDAMEALTVETMLVGPLPEANFLRDGETSELVTQVLTQHYGNWLIRHKLYEEAFEVLGSLVPEDSPYPAELLFNQLVTQHQLLHTNDKLAEVALETGDALLNDTKGISKRYEVLGALMLADVREFIKSKTEQPLDEISRRMTSVSRRLELGHADDEVQGEEQKIIDALTELIEKLEQEQQQQQASASGGGQGGKPGQGQGSQGGQGATPANDSSIAGGSGNGDVDRKDLKDRPGWGNLPPKERREAIQNISRDLPTHYREAIEAYFRKMATDADR
jgi:hypothetical protein